jgi:hypothetical protein
MYRLTIVDAMSDDPPAVETDHISLLDSIAMMVEHLIAVEDDTLRLFPTSPPQEGILEWRIEAASFDGEPEDDEVPQEWWARIENLEVTEPDEPEEKSYSYPMESKFVGPFSDIDLMLLDSMFDRTFRNICEADFARESDGNVEAPTGYFYLVSIPDLGSALNDMIEECQVGREYDDGTWQYPLPAPGWYFVQTDSNGLWWAFGSDTGAEAPARRRFNAAQAEYSKWAQDDEQL